MNFPPGGVQAFFACPPMASPVFRLAGRGNPRVIFERLARSAPKWAFRRSSPAHRPLDSRGLVQRPPPRLPPATRRPCRGTLARVRCGLGRQAGGRTDSELISFGGAPAETGIRLPYGLDLCYALMPPPERVTITLAGLWLKCWFLKGGGAHCLYALDLRFCRLDLDGAGWFCRCSDAWRFVQGV